MAYELTEEDKIKDITRLQNSALRTQNRTLRRSLERLRTDTDAKIAALFEALDAADAALATREQD